MQRKHDMMYWNTAVGMSVDLVFFYYYKWLLIGFCFVNIHTDSNSWYLCRYYRFPKGGNLLHHSYCHYPRRPSRYSQCWILQYTCACIRKVCVKYIRKANNYKWKILIFLTNHIIFFYLDIIYIIMTYIFLKMCSAWLSRFR